MVGARRQNGSRQGVAEPGDCGEAFASLVRDALSHLYDPAYLQTHPLTRYLQVSSGTRQPILGRVLRQALLEAIEALHPGARNDPSIARHSQILQFRYVEGLDARESRSRLSVSKSQFYREHQLALEAVVSILEARWGVGGAVSQGSLDGEPPQTASARPLRDALECSAMGHPRHNLPSQLTSFVGRRAEVAAVRGLLDATRLLTLTGTGGAGKTRMAYEVGRSLLEDVEEIQTPVQSGMARVCSSAPFRDGIWMAELAPLSEPELVPQAVASALGIRESPDRPLLESLVTYLRAKQLLLILDNCEHLVDASARLCEELLKSCSTVTILATSREPLGVTGETTYRVPSLSTPDVRNLPVLEHLDGFEAVTLFVDRARSFQPGFALTDANARVVAEICSRLDGIPLALELAAACVRGLTVGQIASRLDDRFRLLTGGSRTALRRQQTLRATIDWSHDLLSEPERALFRRLAVFSGGWSIEAAESVCAGEGAGTRIEEPDVLDLLLRLVDRSLVVVEDVGSTTRYHLLETIRQYAQLKLAESGESAELRHRHLDWYLVLAERADKELEGQNEREWVEALELEHDNFRLALDWALASDPEVCLRLAVCLMLFWWIRGYRTERRHWLETALARTTERTRWRARALHGLGDLAWTQNDYATGLALIEESAAIYRELGDPDGLSQALRSLGEIAKNLNELERAMSLLEESVALARESGRTMTYNWAVNLLATTVEKAGDFARARSLYEENLAVARHLGNHRAITYPLRDLGKLDAFQGDYEAARAKLESSLSLDREVEDQIGVAFGTRRLADVLRIQGDLPRARALLEESLQLFWRIGFNSAIALALGSLASLVGAEGEHREALGLLREGLALLQGNPDRKAVSQLLYQTGIELIQVGEPVRGVRLAGAASKDAPGKPLQYPVDQAAAETGLEAAREHLGEHPYGLAWAEGQAMTLDEAVEYALRQDA